MPYPDHPSDCPKLEAWRDGKEYGVQEVGGVGKCIECPHRDICVGSEISLVGTMLVDIQTTLKETPSPLDRIENQLLKANS